MSTHRLEAFSDGVIAIIITIMVLELKVPHGTTWDAIHPLWPKFGSYVLSFLFVAIYWNNHHHLLAAAKCANGRILWANMHLLFWLSLVPFTTGWMGENEFAPLPVALYGVVLLFAGIAYFLLAHSLVAEHGADSPIGVALGRDVKGKISIVIYGLAIFLSFYMTWLAYTLYCAVAIMWLVPDRRIESTLNDGKEC